jgi:hypothetical protein
LLKGTLESIPIPRPEPTAEQPQGICLDKAYDNAEVRDVVGDYDLTPHIRARGEEIELKIREPGWRPRRWVVEPLMDEPQPRHPDSLVQKGREPSRAPATRRRTDRIQEGPHRDPSALPNITLLR